MDLFDRGETEANPIKRAVRYYTALAARMAWSAGMSYSHLDDAGAAEFDRIASLENLWGFCLITAGWFLVSKVPVVGTAVNLYLAYEGLKEVWDRIERTKDAFAKWYPAVHDAKNRDELEVASQYFAEGFAIGGIALIEFVVTHAVAKKVMPALLQKFQVPKWFRSLYERAKGKRVVKRLAAETAPQQRKLGILATAERVGSSLPFALRAEGAKQLGSEFPTTTLLLGTAGVLGFSGLLWWASRFEGKKS